ncbi:hypothetical protein, partial [Seonamhaeicola aphaedonensis]|uniref:hypothetical protein n=1 Tax=Seonamhaeicola aphaedonensis TaxID=1461338 RepID=UPI001C6DDD74
IRDYKEELFSNYCSRIYYLFILKAELRLTLSYPQYDKTYENRYNHFNFFDFFQHFWTKVY